MGNVVEIKRKLKKIAFDLTSPELISKLYFRNTLGYSLNLDNPRSLNEKLQWLKLNYWPNCEKAICCADKYAIRDYIKSLGKSELLNDLLFVWDDVNQIEWAELPNKFVIKCNHGCCYNIICKNKNELDEKETKLIISKWLSEDFSKINAELHYSKIKRKIICEKFLDGEIINYNIYVFNGKAKFFSVAGGLGDGIGEHLTYYNIDGSIASFKNKNYPTRENVLSPLLTEMIKTAEYLSKDFPMVRVDLFDIKGKIILSELTFTPGSALIPFDSIEADFILGELLDIGKEIEAYNSKKAR